MSRHIIPLNDIQCLVVLEALRSLLSNDEIHEDDKRIAQDIKCLIRDTVSRDKRRVRDE